MVINNILTRVKSNGYYHYGRHPAFIPQSNICHVLVKYFNANMKDIISIPGHDVNFCSDLPRRASEIQFSLALLQLSLALVKLYIMIL